LPLLCSSLPDLLRHFQAIIVRCVELPEVGAAVHARGFLEGRGLLEGDLQELFHYRGLRAFLSSSWSLCACNSNSRTWRKLLGILKQGKKA
jgi:hypothetical protein